MGRGADTAQHAADQGLQQSKVLSGQAAANYATLMPELQAQMAHPSGYSQPDLAAMETGSQQTEGGAAAGAVGQGGLLATRTNNPGTASAAVAQSARNAGEQLSKNSLGIRTANAGLKEQQREGAQKGLEGLYGQTLGNSNASLGQVAPSVNAGVNASNANLAWTKYIMGLAGGAPA